MITATKQINVNESCEYFAKMYGINYANKYKREDEIRIDDTVPNLYLRMSYPFDDETKTHNSITLSENYRFTPLPYMPLKTQQERSTIYISGASGSGKSWLINSIIKEYKQHYPNNTVYYITKNNWKTDRSLEPKSMYRFVDVNKFIQYYSNEKNIEEFLLDKNKKYHNSFFVFDDIAALEKISKIHANTLQLIIDIILENKRKASISIAILSHVPSNYKQTALLIREMKQYIFFPGNLQTKSDRILNTYLGLNSKEIEKMINNESKISKWCLIDNDRRLVLTQRSCYMLTSTKPNLDDDFDDVKKTKPRVKISK